MIVDIRLIRCKKKWLIQEEPAQGGDFDMVPKARLELAQAYAH